MIKKTFYIIGSLLVFSFLLNNISCAFENKVPTIAKEVFDRYSKIKSYKVWKVVYNQNNEGRNVLLYYRKRPYALRKEFKLKNTKAIEIINEKSEITILPDKKTCFIYNEIKVEVDKETFLENLLKDSSFCETKVIKNNNHQKKCLVFEHNLSVPSIYKDDNNTVFWEIYFFDINTGLLVQIDHLNFNRRIIKQEIFKEYQIDIDIPNSLFDYDIPSDFNVVHMVPTQRTMDSDY